MSDVLVNSQIHIAWQRPEGQDTGQSSEGNGFKPHRLQMRSFESTPIRISHSRRYERCMQRIEVINDELHHFSIFYPKRRDPLNSTARERVIVTPGIRSPPYARCQPSAVVAMQCVNR